MRGSGREPKPCGSFVRPSRRTIPWLPFAGQVTSFDPLRDEPAFSAALDSLGIPNGTGR